MSDAHSLPFIPARTPAPTPASVSISAGGAGQELTRLAHAAINGDRVAMDRLAAAVLPRLRATAKSMTADEPAGATRLPTALACEAFVNILVVPDIPPSVNNTQHLYRLLTRAMRHILIDRARHRGALKRAGGQSSFPVDDSLDNLAIEAEADYPDDLIETMIEELDAIRSEAEARAADGDEELLRRVEALEMRYFAGLTAEQIAEAQVRSVPSLNRDIRFARADLRSRVERRVGPI